MIGNGVATLASTTTLASHGKGNAAPRKGGDDFAQTLDQAMDRGAGARETAASEPHKMPEAPTRHRSIFGEGGWHGQDETSVTARIAQALQRDDGKSGAALQGGTEGQEDETSLPGSTETESVDDTIPQEDAGKRAAVAKSTEDAAAGGDSNERANPVKLGDVETAPADDAVDADMPRDAESARDTEPTDPRLAPHRPEERAAKQDASAKTDRASEGQAVDPAAEKPVSAKPAADDAAPPARAADQAGVGNAPLSADGKHLDRQMTAARREVAQQRAADADLKTGTGAAIESETSRVMSASDRPAAPSVGAGTKVAPDRTAQDGLSRPAPADAAQSATTGRAEPASEPRAPRDPAPATERQARPAARAEAAAPAPAAPAAEKPAYTVSGVQPSPAANGSATPAGQVAEAVSRDLQELAPTRIALAAGGASGRPVKSIRLQLNPAELGTVHIRLQAADGELRVSIRAESDETARMLSRDADTIRATLRAAGVTTSEVTVSVNRSDSATPQFAGQNRDGSGQQTAAQDNREGMSNESRHSNRDGSSRDPQTPFDRGDADSRNTDRGSRVFI